jgi:peptidoglycan hydrolase CwlO-like protein
MKRMVFGAAIALTMVACGGNEETEVTDEPAFDTTAIIEMENATEEVETGLQDLENSVNELNSEIDSLLEGI